MAVYVIGGGFAGCEAAWQLARQGINVKLLDMKPAERSPAHISDSLCELVCSNSFKSKDVTSASGLLKEEMRLLGSLCISAADQTAVPAGGALAVDRERFSEKVTHALKTDPKIEIFTRRIDSLEEIAKEPDAQAVIIATGPLTGDALAEDLKRRIGTESLAFYDAAAPLIYKDSIDFSKAFYASRYGKGDGEYINCPLTMQEYAAFYEALVNADCAEVHGFEEGAVYQDCMPVESMARRGAETLRFGPMKPVGITNPATGEKYAAVVQLRRDNAEDTLYNIVGFQTRLKFPEQRRVFGMIPGLEHAEFARYGVMHRNTYIKSPALLDETYMAVKHDLGVALPVFFAGQLTGVEGYIESASSGLIAGINAAQRIRGGEPVIFTRATQIGALASYAANYGGGDFQPMGANFGIMCYNPLAESGHRPDKKKKKEFISAKALETIEEIKRSRSDYFGR